MTPPIKFTVPFIVLLVAVYVVVKSLAGAASWPDFGNKTAKKQ